MKNMISNVYSDCDITIAVDGIYRTNRTSIAAIKYSYLWMEARYRISFVHAIVPALAVVSIRHAWRVTRSPAPLRPFNVTRRPLLVRDATLCNTYRAYCGQRPLCIPDTDFLMWNFLQKFPLMGWNMNTPKYLFLSCRRG